MGGTMSVIYCALYPEDVENLILLTTGVDFGVDGTLSLWNDKKNFDVDKFVQAHGNIPAEYLQTCFLMMKPVQNFISKYINFYENIEDDKFVENFVAMEKWLGDNIALAGEVFREFVKYFYQQNLLIKNKLRISGKTINLKKIKCPVLNLIAQHDHLVPPASSTILNKLISSKDYKEINYPTGHIGMSVSDKSIIDLWPEAAKWLAKRSRDKSTNILF